MVAICYRPKKFTEAHLAIIDQANSICAEYEAQGLVLTLRQLYYQYVARGLIANKQTEYKRLGDILMDARMAGEMDWDYLIDRTRSVRALRHFSTPGRLIEDASVRYQTDLWAPQHKRVEVWIEKDAGIGVIEQICTDNDVPYFSCRGYTSASEMWAASQRVGEYLRNGEQVTILHIGDHDPSGMHMTEDMTSRLRTFLHHDWIHDPQCPPVIPTALGGRISRGDIYRSMHQMGVPVGGPPWQLKRIALNYDQVLQYNPPPNPAKTTDARYARYVAETGLDESWELDALDPAVLQALIQDEFDAVLDENLWNETRDEMERARTLLGRVARQWDQIVDNLDEESA